MSLSADTGPYYQLIARACTLDVFRVRVASARGLDRRRAAYGGRGLALMSILSAGGGGTARGQSRR